MNLGYTDINPEEVGKFLRGIVSTFINKENPLYNLDYTYYRNGSDCVNYYLDDYKYPLLFTVQSNSLSAYYANIKSPHFVMIDEHNLYFDNKVLKKCSTSDFKDDYFALSTVLDTGTLTILELVSYISDLELHDKGLILRTDNIVYFYNICTIKGTTQ